MNLIILISKLIFPSIINNNNKLYKITLKNSLFISLVILILLKPKYYLENRSKNLIRQWFYKKKNFLNLYNAQQNELRKI